LKPERLAGGQYIECGSQLVSPPLGHDERVILLVIVSIVDQDIENHAAEELPHVPRIPIPLRDTLAPKQLRQFRIAELLTRSAQRHCRREAVATGRADAIETP